MKLLIAIILLVCSVLILLGMSAAAVYIFLLWDMSGLHMGRLARLGIIGIALSIYPIYYQRKHGDLFK
jgi:hypothetical protein